MSFRIGKSVMAGFGEGEMPLLSMIKPANLTKVLIANFLRDKIKPLLDMEDQVQLSFQICHISAFSK